MEYRVFPPIGIRRIGNSQDFFIGPEVLDSKGLELTPTGEVEIVAIRLWRSRRVAFKFSVHLPK